MYLFILWAIIQGITDSFKHQPSFYSKPLLNEMFRSWFPENKAREVDWRYLPEQPTRLSSIKEIPVMDFECRNGKLEDLSHRHISRLFSRCYDSSTNRTSTFTQWAEIRQWKLNSYNSIQKNQNTTIFSSLNYREL